MQRRREPPGTRRGHINADLFELKPGEDDHLGSTCDRNVKLKPGQMVRARVHIHLESNVKSGDYTFKTVFGAVSSSGDAPVTGDVKGDGVPDFIVGAYRTDPGGKTDAGSAYVYSGANGILLYQKHGESTGDNFGTSVGMAGDVNGDGRADFIVGAFGTDPGGKSGAGSAYIYSGFNGNLLYKRDGAATGDALGDSVSTAGDVNGDGRADFIVGAFGTDPGGKNSAGSIYVYSGLNGNLLYSSNGAATGDRYGDSVSAAGDINGDGKADFIVGARLADPGSNLQAGSAYVWFGHDGSLLFTKNGVAAGDHFGYSVGTAGDVNGDGKADFIVGAPFVTTGGKSTAGSAYVYSGADGSLLYQKEGGAAGDNLGISVATAGDANGDGTGDFIVGAYTADPGGKESAGSAYVYSGANGVLLHQKDGASTGDILGYSVSTAGDVNGDGKADFIVGAPSTSIGGNDYAGSAYIYSGANGVVIHQKDGGAEVDNFGISVGGVAP